VRKYGIAQGGAGKAGAHGELNWSVHFSGGFAEGCQAVEQSFPFFTFNLSQLCMYPPPLSHLNRRPRFVDK
jgi:hypothetical protein